MNSPEALAAVDRIRAAAASQDASVEELRALVAESTELVELAVEAIMTFQVAEQVLFQATGIRVPDEAVAAAMEALISDAVKKET